jgi:His/Glu/Gln/Arg/opine family amino acid ABC transporter permease subunit
MILLSLSLCSAQNALAQEPDNNKYSWLCENTIGVSLGTTGDEVVHEICPDSNIKIFNSLLNSYASLKTGKIKYIITTEIYALDLVENNQDTMIVELDLDSKYDISLQVALQLKPDAKNDTFFPTSIFDSAYKIFVENNGLLFFAEGMRNTLFISVISFLLATLIGFLLYFLSLNKHKFSQMFVRGYQSVLNSIPILVTMMLIYYIGFGSFEVEAIWAVILGFALTSASLVYSSIKSSVTAIGNDQNIVAEAMGFSSSEIFQKIYFPQVYYKGFESYTEIFLSIFKGTSIVGILAVFDLTSAVESIRSINYDTITPLIFVTIIYCVSIFLFIRLFRLIFSRTNPRRKK